MIQLIASWVLNALALIIVSKILPGIYIADFNTALIASLIIGLVNALVKPVLIFLTLPITIVTLGFFLLVINAFMLLIAGSITPGFRVDGFLTALVGSILLSLVSTILHSLVQ